MKYYPALVAIPGAGAVITSSVNRENKGHGFSILVLIYVHLLSCDLNCGPLKKNFSHFNEFIILLLTEMSLVSLQGPY